MKASITCAMDFYQQAALLRNKSATSGWSRTIKIEPRRTIGTPQIGSTWLSPWTGDFHAPLFHHGTPSRLSNPWGNCDKGPSRKFVVSASIPFPDSITGLFPCEVERQRWLSTWRRNTQIASVA